MATKFEAAELIETAEKFSDLHWKLSDGIILYITGVNPVTAAESTSKYLRNLDPEYDTIINAGIAGCLDENIPQNSIIVPDRFEMEPAETHLGIGNTFEPIGDGKIKLFTCNFPVWEEDRKKLLKSQGGTLVDMEGYSIAYCCQQAGFQLTSVKVVSDHCSRNTQEEFIEKAKGAITVLSDHLVKNYLS